MTYRYLFLITLLAIPLLNSCKHKDPAPEEPVVTLKITPERARIGDTITITGSDLDKVQSVMVDQEPAFGYDNKFEILQKSSSQIKAIVPAVFNEKIRIKLYDKPVVTDPTPTPALDSLDYDIIGLIELHPSGIGNSSDLSQVKAVDEKTYFAIDHKNAYKSTDGGYSWQTIKTHTGAIINTFFRTGDEGWISLFTDAIVNGFSGGELIYTNDGGKNFRKLPIPDLQTEYITDMHFLSAKEGYLLSNKGSIWYTTDNAAFERIYQFPEKDASNAVQFASFFVEDGNIVAFGQSGFSGDKPVIVKGKGKTFSHKYYDNQILKMQKPVQGSTYAIIGNKLNVSKNMGDTWEKVNDMNIRTFHFFDANYGIGSVWQAGTGEEIILETRDGGKKWTQTRRLSNYVFTSDMDFTEKSGVIAGYSGRIWRYILY